MECVKTAGKFILQHELPLCVLLMTVTRAIYRYYSEDEVFLLHPIIEVSWYNCLITFLWSVLPYHKVRLLIYSNGG